MNKIRVGIIGAAGFTGGELIRILLNHPNAEIVFAVSSSNANKPIHAVHADLFGETTLMFCAAHHSECDVLFLCGGHGFSTVFLSTNVLASEVVIIDLSQDFRLSTVKVHGQRDFVYGLPELQRERISSAKSIANPGCFATAIQLALLPFAKDDSIAGDIHISGTTGSTGAGHGNSPTSHFSWRFANASTYKEFEHQHLLEIRETIQQLQPSFSREINFVPQRGNFTRGILASVYFKSNCSEHELISSAMKFYHAEPFVRVSPLSIDIKQVVNTNRCLLHVAKHGDNVLVTSIIDNLLKGASGQAVQNMNIAFKLDETAGLKLKSSAF